MSTRCLSPITIREGKPDQLTVACNRCPACIRKRVSTWSFRLSKQGEVATSALFVTLTYDTDHVPISPNGYMTLDKTDLQKFFKRLRKFYKFTRDIKYYACGEYGTNNYRPHWHIILFNADYEGVETAWALDGVQIGYIHYGEVTPASIGYTLKYITKEKRVGLHVRDDRAEERSYMSKRLGANYLTDAIKEWHQADLLNRLYAPLKDGKKAPLARYYRDQIYTREQLDIIVAHLHNQSLELEEETPVLTREELYQQIQNGYRYAKENRSKV